MPWKVAKSDEKFCVQVSEGPQKGKVVKCHDSRDKALAQVKALYANTSGHGGSKKPY